MDILNIQDIRQIIHRIETGMSTADDARELERIIERLLEAEQELAWIAKREPMIAHRYAIESWADALRED